MVMKRKLKFFVCIVVCIILPYITFFHKSTMFKRILVNWTQPSASSNQQLMKISPLEVNHNNTRSKDVISHKEEVKKIDNSKKANIVSESDVHEPCNDSLCLNFLSVEDKRRFNYCQKRYEIYKKNISNQLSGAVDTPNEKKKFRRILNMSESCHFKEGKGKYIVRMGRNMV